MTLAKVMKRLRALGDPEVAAGVARFGIPAARALGVTAPQLRRLAREIGVEHALAHALWHTGILEARALATLVEDPARVTVRQMESWARDFDSWSVCDACCYSLFDRTPFAYRQAVAWSRRREEFVKRGAFALMAGLAIHDKAADDARFLPFLRLIRRAATDERHFVKKGVNWALRQIGKRSLSLNRAAIATAEELRQLASASARWIAADALRELRSAAVQRRLLRRQRVVPS